MDYKKLYEKAIERAKTLTNSGFNDFDFVKHIFPELAESEDEKIRKDLIIYLRSILSNKKYGDKFIEGWIAWLEKQGKIVDYYEDRLDECACKYFNKGYKHALEKQVSVDEDEIVKGIRRGVAISLMNHIDANSKGMYLSNMECEDIENAIVNEDWNKVYGYMKKKLEKQGQTFTKKDVDDAYLKGVCDAKQELEKQGEQKPAWSEEDKEMLEDTCRILSNSKECTTSNVRWLKSLKPQNRWKPSDEQVLSLERASNSLVSKEDTVILRKLLNDLKKLEEE